jgi:hypothetical protein
MDRNAVAERLRISPERSSRIEKALFSSLEGVAADFVNEARQKYGDRLGEVRWVSSAVGPSTGQLGITEKGHCGVKSWEVSVGDSSCAVLEVSGSLDRKPGVFC